jgi:hypothetical protein
VRLFSGNKYKRYHLFRQYLSPTPSHHHKERPFIPASRGGAFWAALCNPSLRRAGRVPRRCLPLHRHPHMKQAAKIFDVRAFPTYKPLATLIPRTPPSPEHLPTRRVDVERVWHHSGRTASTGRERRDVERTLTCTADATTGWRKPSIVGTVLGWSSLQMSSRMRCPATNR